jgi:hypothetical protein
MNFDQCKSDPMDYNQDLTMVGARGALRWPQCACYCAIVIGLQDTTQCRCYSTPNCTPPSDYTVFVDVHWNVYHFPPTWI